MSDELAHAEVRDIQWAIDAIMALDLDNARERACCVECEPVLRKLLARRAELQTEGDMGLSVPSR